MTLHPDWCNQEADKDVSCRGPGGLGESVG